MKKIFPILMILSFFIIFLAFIETDNPKLSGYSFEKVLTNSSSYIPDKNPYKIHSELLKIEKKYDVKIIKFSSINENNKVIYNFNLIGKHHLNKNDYFNKNIYVNYKSEKFEDKNALGIYYFSKYNKKIEISLSKLGLNSSNYIFTSVVKRITSIINGTYFYILFVILVVIILKIKFSTSTTKFIAMNKRTIFLKNIFYSILILAISFVILGVLFVYNTWSDIFNFIFYYVSILTLEVVLVYLIYYAISFMLNMKILNKLYFKLKKYFPLIVQYFCSVLLYIILTIFSRPACELYLSYVHSPLKSISNYYTVDLTSFNSSFYIGDEKYDNDCKSFISKQKNVILSSYNVGYNFTKKTIIHTQGIVCWFLITSSILKKLKILMEIYLNLKMMYRTTILV